MALDPRMAAVQGRTAGRATAADIDAGLRSYMLRVYNYMALGVAFTGIVAMFVAMNPALMQTIAVGPARWILFFGILGLGWFSGRIMFAGSAALAHGVFWLYAGMWGALMAPMFHYYTGESIVRVFFMTAGMFAAMSLFGYTTKKNLTGVGQFLAMATFGILIAVLLNAFVFQSAGFHLILAIIVVLIFAGITAWETQQIKEWYFEDDLGDVAQRKAIFGAFLLYGSFVTIFIWLLSIFGSRE